MAGEVLYYTVAEAASMLRLTPERVRQMLEEGEIEGIAGPGGVVPIRDTINAAAAPEQMPPAPSPPAPLPPQPPPGAPPDVENAPAEHPASPAEAIEEVRQPAVVPAGDDAATSRELTSESGWVTTQQAAKALGISARTVRWHIERGNLDAKPEGEGVERTWRVSVDSLQALRDARQRQQRSPRHYRAPTPAAETAAEDPGNAIRELADRLVEEARRAEAARVRLELAERAQSTLETELAEERRRREVAERELGHAQRERAELRRRLEAREDAPQSPPSRGPTDTPPDAGGGEQEPTEPRRSWWNRMFGS